MNKHTSGPWVGFDNGFAIWIKSEEGIFVANLSEQDDKQKAWADARLIAAAPDLYSAARDAVVVIPTGPEKDALVLALLKAEGHDND